MVPHIRNKKIMKLEVYKLLKILVLGGERTPYVTNPFTLKLETSEA